MLPLLKIFPHIIISSSFSNIIFTEKWDNFKLILLVIIWFLYFLLTPTENSKLSKRKYRAFHIVVLNIKASNRFLLNCQVERK
jgi:hypothetical protein